MRLKTKAFAIIFACVAMLTMTGVAGAWVYADGPIAPVNVTASVDIAEFSYVQGVYISSFEMLTSNQSTSVNSVSNDESKLTATMNLKSGSSQAKIKVNFFNNTNFKLTLQTVSGSVFDGIDDASPKSRIVEAHQSLSCDVVFFANNNAQNVVFNFAKIGSSDAPVASVMDGANSDNINALGDGSKNISTDTAYRWTNWESVSGTFVAQPAVLALALSESQQVDKIEIYHFVDAGKPYPCDFPASITVEYFDGTQYQTILVANLTKNGTTVTGYQSQSQGITVSQNWSNAVRTGSDKVYNMTINGNSANFAAGNYKGVAPCTTFAFASVNTDSLRVTFTPQTQTFVGIVEVVVG